MTDQPGGPSPSDVETFRSRASTWLAQNLPPRSPRETQAATEDDVVLTNRRERLHQRKLFDAGLAGICFPTEYGGLGLPIEYQRAFNEIALPYDVPYRLNFPTLAICAPVILELGTDEQKQQHVPRILRGEEFVCQLLSEPSGGSDLASARTRAVRDGDEFVVNGAKVWSSAAGVSDYGLLLARTDWDVPKHQGLTMFLVDMKLPGITTRVIRQVTEVGEFYEVNFEDVRVPVEATLGEVNGGWNAATAQLAYERLTAGGASRYVSGVGANDRATEERDLFELASKTSQLGDPLVRLLLAEAYAARRVQEQVVERVSGAIASGHLPAAAGTIVRITRAQTDWRVADIGLEIAGAGAVAGGSESDGASAYGDLFLNRQRTSIGGGTTEMARSVLSERVLGLPREPTADRGIPFKEVRSGP